MNTLRRHWRIAVPVGLFVIAAGWWLAFSFFGVQTLFFDDKVDEDGPVFASGAAATDEAVDVPVDDPAADDAATTTAPAEPTPAQPETTEPVPTTVEPEVLTLARGTFGARSHPGSGSAVVLGDGTDQRFLRFEDDFSTDNGPDLDVYLSSAPPDAPEGAFDDDFVDLGELKGNIGAQNYEIPADVDLDHYSTVVVWCVRFAVAFTTADLA